MKLLKERVTRQVDAALEEHARAAEGLAGQVRLWLAATCVATGAWFWAQPSYLAVIYFALAAAWLLAWGVSARRKGAEAGALMTTLLDVAIAHGGLLAFVAQGLFPQLGGGLFLCYFPILAVAAMRYRATPVLAASGFALVGYAVISLRGGSAPWFRLSLLAAATFVFIAAARRPKSLMVGVATDALQEAYEKGAQQKELELTAQVHELFLPPPIIDQSAIWAASKHAAGTESGGDYYHVFDTERGPLVAVGNLPGKGFDALHATSQLHQTLTKLVGLKLTLPQLLEGLNAFLYEKYHGARTFTGVLAQWEGERLRYVNAGQPPLMQISKPPGAQVAARKQLPVTGDAVGATAHAAFTAAVVPFPVRDLLVLYTAGLYAKLTGDREQGVAQLEALADQFSSGEVTTLCHRLFDCAQIGLEPAKDDATIVVIRRQPAALAAAADKA